MSASIESMGVSVAGAVVRKFDGTNTTLMFNQAQARELFDTLAPILEFFDKQAPQAATEVIDASKSA